MTVLRSGSATDVGRVRKDNQDLPLEAQNLFAVADGMGGHVGGEVAARVAIDALLSSFTREPTTSGLQGAFSDANQAVWQESQIQKDLHGMGTTLTAVALVGGADGRDMLALANVGDSRAYVYSEGVITQITADHSLAEERMRLGEMTEEEAAVHPQRHILTRALGIFPEVEADMWELQLRSGDRVVLCSDGLSNELSLQEFSEILAAHSDPGEAARVLVDAANEHGGSDNITVIVVDVLVGEEGSLPASVVKPIGQRAGPALIVAPAAIAGASGAGAVARPITGELPVTPRRDALAPGAQLGFGGDSARLSSDGPQSGEHFLGKTESGPIARSSVRAQSPLPPLPIPPNESRRARRRRLGIPRRITVRVVLFFLILAAVPFGAFYAVRWYAYDNWYPGIHGTNVVIYQGRSGGVLWFHPKVVAHTVTSDDNGSKVTVTTSNINSSAVSDIRAGVQEPSLQAAKSYVINLYTEYVFQHSSSTTTTLPGGTTGIGPGGSTTTSTTPTQAP